MKNIRGLLFPQEGIFFELLEKQSKEILKASNLLWELISKASKNTDEYRKKIKKIEHQGDDVVSKIHERLNSSFITPIDHEDIAQLANTYDDVLDGIYTFANRLHIYNIRRIDKPLKDFSKIVLDATREIDKAFSSMKKLSQKQLDVHTVIVKRLEREADDLLDSATADLFKKKNFVQILKYKELYEILEGVTDRCMDVVDVMRNIVLKHS